MDFKELSRLLFQVSQKLQSWGFHTPNVVCIPHLALKSISRIGIHKGIRRMAIRGKLASF